jgi:hypothetical protein
MRDEGAVRAAHAWSAAMIDYKLHDAGDGVMHPDMRAEVGDIIARLNARADGRDWAGIEPAAEGERDA